MKKAQVSELKALLSQYLAYVKEGEEVVVTERGRPIAKLVPLTEAESSDDHRLLLLERAGLARRGASLDPSFWTQEGPRDPDGDLLRTLLDERRTGR